ncbi:MAG TPA: beta-ketoacyl synthase N-terminal-like domain-containing protein [Chitinivibrionales bacterium]|nr:beta-ketoacyl synthase N-terminal-like domain-containing protein [Chitinivibrionales bacterium]
MEPKIVITTASAIHCLGRNLDEISASLALPPRTSYLKDFGFHSLSKDTPCFRIGDFEPEAILGKKGLRTKDHATKLLLSAIELGFKDLFESTPEPARPGLCIGTSFGSVQSIGDFLSDAIINGFHNVNPQAFANTVINAPTSNANIRYLSRALSSTVSTTFNAGLDALAYAAMFLRRGYASWLIAGGLEELSYYALIGLDKNGSLSASGVCAPFGATADGTVAGEGCAVFCLETEEHAKSRGAHIIAELAGIASCFDPKKGPQGFNLAGDGCRHAMRQACGDAGISLSDIAFVAASAGGVPDGDTMEAGALAGLFPKTPVAAYKAKTGECIGASSCISTACALADMKAQRVSGIGNAYPLSLPVNLVFETRTGVPAEFVLINSFSCDGYCGSIVLKNRS